MTGVEAGFDVKVTWSLAALLCLAAGIVVSVVGCCTATWLALAAGTAMTVMGACWLALSIREERVLAP